MFPKNSKTSSAYIFACLLWWTFWTFGVSNKTLSKRFKAPHWYFVGLFNLRNIILIRVRCCLSNLWGHRLSKPVVCHHMSDFFYSQGHWPLSKFKKKCAPKKRDSSWAIWFDVLSRFRLSLKLFTAWNKGQRLQGNENRQEATNVKGCKAMKTV